MPNANWSNPTLTSTYTNFVTEVKNRDEDLALQFDGTTSTNIPTNTIRWDSAANRWKKWNGSSWAELTSTYALTALSTTGNATVGTTLNVTGAATLSSTLAVTGAVTGGSTVSGTALVPTSATVPTVGTFLPAANTVAIATASTERIRFGPSGQVGIAGANYGTAGHVLTSGGASAAPSWTAVAAATDPLPSQTGNSGKYLGTNGTAASWQTIVATSPLPSQTGNSGKYLGTDGTAASWQSIVATSPLPSQTGNSGKYLSTDGSAATWQAIVAGLRGANVFTSSGNWTCPAGVTKVLATVVGGGGGGRGSSSTVQGQTGGAGGYGIGIVTVTPGTVYTVTVGGGGNGGAVNAVGIAGGTSTFSTISATGGAAGTALNTTIAASGSCSSADATLRRSDVSSSHPFLVNGMTTERSYLSGTTAEAWSISSGFCAGARGDGASQVNSTGGGAVGGAVALLY